jgi:hypothetical protein
MARLESAIVWLVASVVLGLVLTIGGQALLGVTAGNPPSILNLTQKGELFPGGALLCLIGVIEMLRKPANLYRFERVFLGLFGLSIVVVALIWWGETLALYAYNGPVDPAIVSGGSLWLYGFSVLVGGICVVRAERR